MSRREAGRTAFPRHRSTCGNQTRMLTSIMNRIVISAFLVRVGSRAPDGINRLNPGSTYTSNQRLRDRQRQNLFLGKHLLCAGNALSYPSNGPVLEE